MDWHRSGFPHTEPHSIESVMHCNSLTHQPAHHGHGDRVGTDHRRHHTIMQVLAMRNHPYTRAHGRDLSGGPAPDGAAVSGYTGDCVSGILNCDLFRISVTPSNDVVQLGLGPVLVVVGGLCRMSENDSVCYGAVRTAGSSDRCSCSTLPIFSL
jgi:hypothetical protein